MRLAPPLYKEHPDRVWSSAMSAHEKVLGRVDAGGEIRRAPLVGMQFLHQGAVRGADRIEPGIRLKPQDLVGFLLRHGPWFRTPARPRIAITLSVFTPSGKPAVEIRL